jgi:2-methylcitrate dehydratase PrpD
MTVEAGGRGAKMKPDGSDTRHQLETAAVWAASFRLDQAPRDVLELATWQIADILAAILAGSRSAAGQKIWRATQTTLRPGPCTAIPHGTRVSLWDALYLHAAYATALELDDFHYRGHMGQAAVVVPLALAELLGRDGSTALRAQIVANELAGRLGWAVTAEIRHGHLRSYLQRFAAAAAAGVFLDLSEAEFANAFAIALTLPDLPLHPGMYSPETKALAGAAGVVEGVRAAFLAKEGLTGARDILEHRAGFYRQFTLQRHVRSPFVQLGEAWSMHALSFKRYAACGYASGAVEAACEIQARREFQPGDVDHIEVATSVTGLIMERLAEPHEPNVWTPVNIQFSILRSVAAALAFGELRGFHFAAEAFPRMLPEVERLSRRSRLVHDWKFTVHQLIGIDAGLNKGGGKHSADTLQFYRTSRVFRSMFGSARVLGPRDIVQILRLPKEERDFFLKRWGRSLGSHLRQTPTHHDEGYRPLGDLRRLSWRMGSRVTVRLKNGRSLSAERILPSGMAGDPNRGGVVRDKLIAEGEVILGRERCRRLWELVTGLPVTPPASILAQAVEEGNEQSRIEKD